MSHEAMYFPGYLFMIMYIGGFIWLYCDRTKQLDDYERDKRDRDNG